MHFIQIKELALLVAVFCCLISIQCSRAISIDHRNSLIREQSLIGPQGVVFVDPQKSDHPLMPTKEINLYQRQQQPVDLETNKLDHKQASSTKAPLLNHHDHRRPIWNLVHMVNSIKELEYRLNTGANAVETDVTFSRDGDPLYTYHGPPCDCWRHCHQQEDFNEYLRYIREIAIENQQLPPETLLNSSNELLSSNYPLGKNLTLLFLDLKLDYLDNKSKARAGQELAKSVIENLFSPSSIELDSDEKNRQLIRKKFYLIISINHVTDVELIYNFLHHFEQNNSSKLLEKIGFDVGMNDDLQLIESMWKRVNLNSINIWQGDGYTNCFSPFHNLERLSKALVKRDLDFGYPKKVYHWTIDLHDRIRESLLMGVDAIMTNHPERVISVLREPEMAHNYRLANEFDDPFERITRKLAMKNVESARYQRSTHPTSGGFFGSLYDVITSWLAYIREIPFLSLPTTSRFIPKVKRHKTVVISNNLARSSPSGGGAQSNTTAQAQIQLDSNPGPSLNATLTMATNTTLGDLPPAAPYMGPKWYTSLTSNLLVSMLKLMLPEN